MALRAFKERPLRRTIRGTRVATALGIVTLICAVFGIAYNADTLTFVMNGGDDAVARSYSLTHFYAAFYAMSAICITCYLALAWGAYQLIRRRLTATRWLVSVWLFEIVYFFALGVLWLVPGIGPSIAGATGVANGGLMVQFVILLPIWGPLALLWINRLPSPTGPVVAVL